MMSGPLTGFSVVDVSSVVSGPLASMIMADQGADVIKVESPGLGDLTRLPMNLRDGMTGLFANCNRGKRSIVIDLKADAGRGIVLDLVKNADVFIENWRPGAAERLGLGEDSVREVNSNIIYASVSGFGPTGPYSGQRVYDPVVQALTGVIAAQINPRTGVRDLVRNIVADKATSYTLVQAITAALLARERGRGGQRLDVPMLDATLSFLWPDGMMEETMVGEGVLAPTTLSNVYYLWDTADGQVVAFFASDSEVEGMARALEHPEWLEDETLTDPAQRLQLHNFERIAAMIEEVMRNYTTAEIVERFREHEVPVAPVLTREEVFEDAQVTHNEAVYIENHPVYGDVRQPSPGARFSGTPSTRGALAPLLGEHTNDVLRELGYADERAAQLRREGVVF
jgi:crotonobetainyl-CoA:carnitine CoA-transferase CaiB-like acyl-CoA transferase